MEIIFRILTYFGGVRNVQPNLEMNPFNLQNICEIDG
jgi:hypothetical protein